MKRKKRDKSRRRLIIFNISVALVLVTLLCLLLLLPKPAQDDLDAISLEMSGDRVMQIEYGQAFVEPGIQALLNDKDPVPVQTEGSVDHNVLGSYELKYVASLDGLTATAYRRVEVVDTTPPEIQLQMIEGHFTHPGQPYQEEGFSATDLYDGDLTDKVKVEEKDGVVTYTVTDSSGNQAAATRKIVYLDPEPPTLTLKGSEYMAVQLGNSFQEPGFTAIDDCDGDISSQVTINGKVDTTSPGVYVLEYVSQDAYGNRSSAKRTVCVIDNQGEPIVPSTGKVIYLTFDDGPGPHTDRLLDILAKYNVKATFFVVNTGSIGKIERAAREGHTVAIHTTTHKFSQIYASDEAFFNDLYTMQGVIESHTGQKSMLMRFPGGSSNTISKLYNQGIMSRLTRKVVDAGFHYFDWNVDSDDAGRATTAEEVFNNVTNGVSKYKTSVVLQHDIYDFSVDAVEQIIVWGIANGYAFAPLTAGSPGCHHGVSN